MQYKATTLQHLMQPDAAIIQEDDLVTKKRTDPKLVFMSPAEPDTWLANVISLFDDNSRHQVVGESLPTTSSPSLLQQQSLLASGRCGVVS